LTLLFLTEFVEVTLKKLAVAAHAWTIHHTCNLLNLKYGVLEQLLYHLIDVVCKY